MLTDKQIDLVIGVQDRMRARGVEPPSEAITYADMAREIKALRVVAMRVHVLSDRWGRQPIMHPSSLYTLREKWAAIAKSARACLPEFK